MKIPVNLKLSPDAARELRELVSEAVEIAAPGGIYLKEMSDALSQIDLVLIAAGETAQDALKREAHR